MYSSATGNCCGDLYFYEQVRKILKRRCSQPGKAFATALVVLPPFLQRLIVLIDQ
jgi:hypothetical protein